MITFAKIIYSAVKRTTSAGLLLILMTTIPGRMKAETKEMLPALKPEISINDFTFDTREVVMDYYFECVTGKVALKGEAETNDIPFYTACIVYFYRENATRTNPYASPDCLIQTTGANAPPTIKTTTKHSVPLPNIALPPEEDANDVPFDTSTVIAQLIENSNKPGNATIEELGQVLITPRLQRVFKAGFVIMLALLAAGILAFLFFNYLLI
ncbi:MAG: hypothetical protein U1C46_03990 [Bacteroidales bacterium]|nr:hypothetical protein [Bacteroidales bacterium]MDZ4203963.1 hypothetical protein [Bacteroidales bacterium]